MKNHKKAIYIVILLLLIFITLFTGRYKLDLKDLIVNFKDSQEFMILFNIRLPRLILVVISGAALALSGMVFQNIFQNPLISPDVLGLTSGCSLGAVIAILFMGANPIAIQINSFVFGILSVVFSLILAKNVKENRMLALVISGIVTGAIASALIMIFKYFADPYKELPSIEYWLMGGFHNSTWKDVFYVIPIVVICVIAINLIKWQLKVVTMGDTQAKLLGVNLKRIRILAIFFSTLLVSSVVSVAGIVSWIGLLAPHIVKLHSSNDITKTIFLTLLMGSILLLVADTLARSISSTEIPISILTSLVGAPFLVYLINKRGDKNRIG